MHIITWISIVFFVISPSLSLLRYEEDSVYMKSARRSRRNRCPQSQRRNFTTGKCDPICARNAYSCVNGKCKAGNECECNFGYELSKTEILLCERIECDENCTFGKCAAKNQPCQCDKGYVRSGDVCRATICEKPRCTEFENCVGDNRCACIKGYGKSRYDSSCKPWCNSDQPTGESECTPRNSACEISTSPGSILAAIITVLVIEGRMSMQALHM